MRMGQDNHTAADVCANYQDTRVAVLGASGFVGRWVAGALGACGAKLFLVVRDPGRAQVLFERYAIEGEAIAVDLGDESGKLEASLERIRPAIVFNLAGYGVDRSERDEDTAFRINRDLLPRLCETLARIDAGDWTGQRIVHVGSALEYGEIGGDLHESSQPRPSTLYGRSKLAGSLALAQCCDRLDVKGLTARLFTVYGPGEHAGRLLPALIETANSGEVLPLTEGLQQRDFTYVEDVAHGLLRLGVDNTPGGAIVNLATGRLMTVRQFVETAARVLSIPAARLRFGAIPTRAEEMAHLPVSIERMRRMIDWIPETDVSEGVRRTAAFLAQ